MLLLVLQTPRNRILYVFESLIWLLFRRPSSAALLGPWTKGLSGKRDVQNRDSRSCTLIITHINTSYWSERFERLFYSLFPDFVINWTNIDFTHNRYCSLLLNLLSFLSVFYESSDSIVWFRAVTLITDYYKNRSLHFLFLFCLFSHSEFQTDFHRVSFRPQ